MYLGPCRKIVMKLVWKKILGSFWSRPDAVLASAGRSGEVVMAKIRLGLAVIILAIPTIDNIVFPMDPKESLVGFGLATGTFLFAAAAYWMVSRDRREEPMTLALMSGDNGPGLCFTRR